MKLVIVESPSKAKTINKYLGKDYVVLASYGHIRKLVSKKGSVDPQKNFEMTWEETLQAKKYLKPIIASIKFANEILLATDPDREGEAISWHLIDYLKSKKLLKKETIIKRVVFNSITKDNILEAFKNARGIDSNLVDAYKTRTALDYLVGFGISPILWRKLPGSRSAGRVQSVALKLICERENEIESFNPVEYWSIITTLQGEKQEELKAKLASFNGEILDKLSITNAEQAESIKEKILANNFFLQEIENKKLTRNPYAPFTTSTLQQDAFNKLGFSAKKTMQLAQKLYEGVNIGKETLGLITYMRTDATQIETTFIQQIRSYIENQIGKNYLYKSLRIYKTKAKNAQEAHEAIRPTAVERTPQSLSIHLDSDMLKLYSLIWQRAVASQMESASYDNCVYHLNNKDNSIGLRASGSILTFDGFYKVYKAENKDDKEETENILPKLELNAKLTPTDVENKQHFTAPPPRYSEASLVKSLEALGIGRPSTYASIISVLQERQYTKIDKKRFVPEARGRILNIFLNHYFSKIIEYNFTAGLEEHLDSISNGDEKWTEVLKNFWQDFNANLKIAEQISVPEVIEVINKEALGHFLGENTQCPKCKTGTLQIKTSKFGAFIGCSNYPDCTYTKQLEVNDNEEENLSEKIDNKFLGQSADGFDIYLKKGPYGYYVEKSTPTPKRTAVPANTNINDITLEKALFFTSLPLTLSKEISFSIGKFGPYLKKGKDFFSYKGDIFDLTLEKAQEIIDSTLRKKDGIILGQHNKKDITLKSSRYGAYLVYNSKNIKIPKEYKNTKIDLITALEIISKEKK